MWRWKVNRVATHRKISAPEYEIFALTLAMSSRLNKGANMSSVLGVFSFKCILKKNKLPQGQKCETQRSEPRWRQRISLASCWREKRQRISLVCTATCHNYVNIIEHVQLRHLWKHCPITVVLFSPPVNSYETRLLQLQTSVSFSWMLFSWLLKS